MGPTAKACRFALAASLPLMLTFGCTRSYYKAMASLA
jgi:hypothetical protein